MNMHGGDIYRNQVKLDFSVNVNPLGMPAAVKTALRQAVERCDRYPDMEAAGLKSAVSGMLGVPKENLLFGNGASELFMAIVHGIKPKKTVLPVPSFYGYEYAAKAAGGEILYPVLPDLVQCLQENDTCMAEKLREADTCMAEKLCGVLTEDVDLLFLANPNNPTGRLWSRDGLRRILRHCRENKIYVVLDECFIEFSGNQYSMLSEIDALDHVILVRAFTKIFAIPGVRLGYLVCKNHSLLRRIAKQLPEWNLSCFAQEAGCICANQTEFVLQTEKYVRQERQFLKEGLLQKNLLVFPSMANFILAYSEVPYYGQLLEKGILIRDCRSFRGLCQGFYRIAVKSRTENEILLESMREQKQTRRDRWKK